jgi:hypothetical protein
MADRWLRRCRLLLAVLVLFLNNLKLGGTHFPALIYFSFVTLATLGYGDIPPVAKTDGGEAK